MLNLSFFKKDLIINMEFYPYCPISLQVPHTITIANQNYYLFQIFDHISSVLTEFRNIQIKLDSLPTAHEKLGFFENIRDKLTSEVTLLVEEQEMLLKIKENQLSPKLVNYITTWMIVSIAAQQWSAYLENSILTNKNESDLSSSVFSPNSIDPELELKISGFEERAQLLLLNENSSSNSNSIEELKKEIEDTVALYKKKNSKKYGPLLQKLSNVQQFLNTSNPSNEPISELETMLFSIIEKANGIDKSNPKAIQAIREKINLLKKSMASQRTNLEKKLKQQPSLDSKTESNQLSEEEKKTLQVISLRIEDLQENLADFEYTFSSKFEGQKVKETKQKITTQHTNTSEDMFAL